MAKGTHRRTSGGSGGRSGRHRRPEPARRTGRIAGVVGTAAVIAASTGVAAAAPAAASTREVTTAAPLEAPRVSQGYLSAAFTPSERASAPRTYVVRRGDTLSRIGHRYGVSWRRLCRVNHLRSCDMIRVGQRLTIRGGHAAHTRAAHVSRSRRRTAGGSCRAPSSTESWIIHRESGGRVTAKNPSSSAFGLGQLLRANRVRYAARLGVSPGTTSRCAQLSMFRMYVADRYGSAAAAKRFWLAHHWY